MIGESFATIVGLLNQFRSERSNKSQSDFNEFMKWLSNSHHDQLKEQLDINTNVTVYIKALLNQDHETFKNKLDKIDAAITAFASTIEGFDDLAKSINPNATLSDQSIDILRQFNDSGATSALKLEMSSGNEYVFLETSENLEINEQRFAEDDFKSLVEFGLLRLDYNSNGDDLYIFTRAAARLVNENIS